MYWTYAVKLVHIFRTQLPELLNLSLVTMKDVLLTVNLLPNLESFLDKCSRLREKDILVDNEIALVKGLQNVLI